MTAKYGRFFDSSDADLTTRLNDDNNKDNKSDAAIGSAERSDDNFGDCERYDPPKKQLKPKQSDTGRINIKGRWSTSRLTMPYSCVGPDAYER